MITTTRHKISAVALALAAAAFVVDRIFIGSDASAPSQATAQTTTDNPSPSQTYHGGNAPIDPVKVPLTLKTSNSNRLAKIAGQRDVNPQNVDDAFAPGHAWGQRPGSSQAPEDAAHHFRTTYSLIALIKEDDVGFAIINDRTLRIGQSIDGFELIEVGKQSAIFESEDQRIELKLISNKSQ